MVSPSHQLCSLLVLTALSVVTKKSLQSIHMHVIIINPDYRQYTLVKDVIILHDLGHWEHIEVERKCPKNAALRDPCMVQTHNY